MSVSVKQIVEFDHVEIKKLLQDKAATLIGDVAGMSSSIIIQAEGEELKATVTFNKATCGHGK